MAARSLLRPTLAGCRRCVVDIDPMRMTTRGATAAGPLLAVLLLLTGCEEVVEKPSKETGSTTAPDDTPRPPKGKPTGPQPAHGETGVTLNTNLKWSAAAGATSYQVYFGTDSTPDSSELKGDQAETTFDPGKLEYDTIYYWQVDSKNKVGTITGDVWRFRTEAIPIPKPEKATSPEPAHDATEVSLDTTLEWSAAPRATSYDVYFGASSPGELQGEQTGTTLKPDTALKYDTTYYWRVNTKNAGGTTTGDVWSFTTKAEPAQKATNPKPEHDATNVSILDNLSWSAATGATHYVVYFGTARSPGGNELSDEQTGTKSSVKLKYNTTYFWRVNTKNEGGTITIGDVWSFTTVAAASASLPSLPFNEARRPSMNWKP